MTQIVHGGRTVTDVVVAFDVRWDGDLAGAGSVLWSMVVTSQDGQESVQLGYRITGDSVEQFVHDLNGARRDDIDPDADLRDHEITVRFPTSRVGVAAHWPTWRAVITVDGEDIAEHVLAAT
jgi:hypothetical protein